MSEKEGFGDAVSRSEGDIRVFLALNALLSTVFAAAIVWGLSYLDFIAWSLLNVATTAIVLFSFAYLMSSS